jgi:hypothetical protein
MNDLPEVIVLMMLFIACVLGFFWSLILPVVGMLYMLGYLT